ncbi:MAG: GNAT family N-acetyltransferase [Bacteroides sp.]|nr:GNAT family N-acetyltransferase [Bacteroides sp.]
MKPSYFINERIRLRAIEPEDLEVIYTMENDSQTWDVTNFTVPYSKFVLKQYIENSQCDVFADRQLRMMIVRREDDAVIGTVDITDYATMHQRGEVGIVVRREYQGNGYAADALKLLCEYVFGFLFMKQLIVHVAADNEASLRLFASCGFVQCGVLKEWWFVGGHYKDVVLMQCLRPADRER